MTIAVDDMLSAAATIRAEVGARPSAAAIAVSASDRDHDLAEARARTPAAACSRMRSNDSSRPMVNRSDDDAEAGDPVDRLDIADARTR